MAPGHKEKWVEDVEPTPLIAMCRWEFHIKIFRMSRLGIAQERISKGLGVEQKNNWLPFVENASTGIFDKCSYPGDKVNPISI